jgi:hypothetical protein
MSSLSIWSRARGICALSALILASTVSAPTLAQSAGPDVTVFTLSDTSNYGVAAGIRGYSVGTVSCNIGTTPLNWCDNTGGCGNGTTSADHPVIAQNVYRLKNGRFDQIGASWLKHGFVSTNSFAAECGNCVSPPLGGNQLGVGCTDPYGSGLNGSRPLGRKSEVNPTTGQYPHPPGGGGSTANVWNQRAAVAEVDLDAANNPSARYFVEGHYVAPDDAQAGNGLNNASYREVSVQAGTFNLSFVGSTVRRKVALEVWPTIDNTVQFMTVDTATTPVERFNVARKVTETAPGTWHYEYAVHNMNSNRAAGSFHVQFFTPPTITNIGFHDVNAHSNEPYDTTDWTGGLVGNTLSWQAVPFTPAQNANALRWATMYNFWFDANQPPTEVEIHRIGMFNAGSPSELPFLPGNSNLFSNAFE